MSDFVPEDPNQIAAWDRLRDAYQEDPAAVGAQIAAEAAAQAVQQLAPTVQTIVDDYQQKAQEDAAEEALQAMDKAYGPQWRGRYAEAVHDFFVAHPGMIPEEKAHDAQFVAEATQAAYRAVKPTVDKKAAAAEWEAVRNVPASYSDSMWRARR